MSKARPKRTLSDGEEEGIRRGGIGGKKKVRRGTDETLKTRMKEPDEEDLFLEVETMKKYGCKGGWSTGPLGTSSKTGEISMIVYRMFILNHRRADRCYSDNAHHLRNRTVYKPRPKDQPLQASDIERCWGRLDFGLESDKAYILSASRRLATSTRRSDSQMTLYCENSSGLVSNPHCEFTAPRHSDDFIWIKDLSGTHGTFVNGIKITPLTKYKLVDGDTIGLGVPHDCTDPRVDVKSRRFYILKVKNVKKFHQELNGGGVSEGFGLGIAQNESTCTSPVDSALGNVLIVDKILKYLKLKELKKCRSINGFWKSRADILMVQESQIKFECGNHPRLSLSEVKWSTSFQQKVDLIRTYGCENFEIDLTAPSSGRAPRHYISDIFWLLDNMGSYMKDLMLSMSIVQDPKGLKFKRVFSRLTNVETLDLSLDITTNFYPVLGSVPLSLPTVKSLALWIHDVEGEEEMKDPYKNHVMSEIAKLFPNLQAISVKTGLLNPFLQFLNRNRDSWKNLKEISAEFELYSGVDNPELSFNTISSLYSTHKLTKLHLEDIPGLDDTLLDALHNMLKKLSPNLESLSLKFAEPNEERRPTVRLPRFPKLRYLQIIIFLDDEDLPLSLTFPSGPICYEEDFPELRTLSLLPADFIVEDPYEDVPTNVAAILDMFLPETRTVSQTVRWVEFCLDEDVTKASNPKYEWYTSFLRRFQRTFPYVHNPDIIKGLQSLPTSQ